MNNIFVAITLTTLAFLAGCSDDSFATFKPPQIAENIVSTSSAVVREVSYVNDERNSAITVIRTTDKDGLSMVRYRFYGYHPEITIGANVELTYLYQEIKGQTTTHSTYLTRVCVKTPGEKETCADN